MRKREIEQVEALHLNVAVADNTRQDRLLGGPSTVGFDFYVDPEQVADLRRLIEVEVGKLELPYCQIHEEDRRWIQPHQLWDAEKIAVCIQKEGKSMQRYLGG